MYPYMYYHNQAFRQTDSLMNDIAKAINGEHSAIICYEKLAEMAPSAQIREQILEIRMDEMKHFQNFLHIYMNATGQKPDMKITEECPDTFKAGVQSAFLDEQETVDFYLDISEKATDPAIQQVFKRAAADEQNHAVWFLYFLTK